MRAQHSEFGALRHRNGPMSTRCTHSENGILFLAALQVWASWSMLVWAFKPLRCTLNWLASPPAGVALHHASSTSSSRWYGRHRVASGGEIGDFFSLVRRRGFLYSAGMPLKIQKQMPELCSCTRRFEANHSLRRPYLLTFVGGPGGCESVLCGHAF